MKNYIKTGLLTLLLSMPALQCMEEQYSKLQPKLLEDLGLPNEIWAQILEYIYLDPNYFFNPAILDEAKDIYDGIDIIEKYIQKCLQTISLVCKTFRNLNISKDQWAKLKEEIRGFYIPHLNDRFLERHQGKTGLYPKGGKWHSAWNKFFSRNDKIAQFIATGIMPVDDPSSPLTVAAGDNNLKLINLLLWYGANPNLQDDDGTALYQAVLNYQFEYCNNIDLITLLLQYGANPNLQNEDGETALYRAVKNHEPENDIKSVIILLLQHSANPDIRANDGKTAGDLALERGLDLNALFPKE